MLWWLVFLGAAINLFGTSIYIRDTLKGKTKPNRVTFLLWSIAPLIGTGAALASGVTWAILPVFMSGFCPLLVLLASFVNPNAYWKLRGYDYLCGFFSLLALLLWAITSQPVLAIIFSIVSDASAALPTLIKSWDHPETETGVSYVFAFFSVLTSYAAIKTWTFPNYGFTVYLTIMDALLALFCYRPKLFKIGIKGKFNAG